MPFDLHRQLQQIYAGDDGQCEVRLNGLFVADVFRHGVIFEIQTTQLSKIRKKIATLLETTPVVIVYPISISTTIVHLEGDDLHERDRRLSPKRGNILDVFGETVYFAQLLAHPNMALEIVLVDTEDIRIKGDPHAASRRRRRRRRKSEWTTINRRLTATHERIRLDTPADGLRLLPEQLSPEFTTTQLGHVADISRSRAQEITYTLFHMGALVRTKRNKEGWWYERR
jgi:hypothetical protein